MSKWKQKWFRGIWKRSILSNLNNLIWVQHSYFLPIYITNSPNTTLQIVLSWWHCSSQVTIWLIWSKFVEKISTSQKIKFYTCNIIINALWTIQRRFQITNETSTVLQIRVFRMAGDFFVRALQGWSGLLGKSTKSQKTKPILKISKAEFGLFKVLFYSYKSQNFYSIILLQKRSSYHSILIVFLKCLVLT